jgi:trk system potassium uptake protein TrkH
MRQLWDLPTGRRPSLLQRLTPPQFLLLSFALLILLGTLGLKTLPGLYTGEPLGWLDALFTATSAVCVTGLVVVDTATYFTFRGQLFLLILIQLGGLGTLTFASLVILALGGRISLRQEALAIGNPLEIGYNRINPRRLVRDVAVFTFGIELIGMLLLYALWVPHLGWANAVWPAVFHSVSAFCNAGFSTFSDNLMGFHNAPLILLAISALIVAGGLGFLTLEELYLWRKAQREKRIFRLSLHSRLVLVTTAILLVAPWPVYVWLEWDASFAPMGVVDKLSNGLFIGVTARTAGFNAIDHSKATEATNFLTIVLMAIGGSPGSMAGGMKTTTVALLVVLAWSRLRGQDVAGVWGRSLRRETTDRAIGLFTIGFVTVTISILALTVTERHTAVGGFLDRMFEAVSAFNLVGLSMGLTPHLTRTGRVIVIGLMFLGRVGPLAAAAALSARPSGASKFRYAYEEVSVG